jgi:hypothetical protein
MNVEYYLELYDMRTFDWSCEFVKCKMVFELDGMSKEAYM